MNTASETTNHHTKNLCPAAMRSYTVRYLLQDHD